MPQTDIRKKLSEDLEGMLMTLLEVTERDYDDQSSETVPEGAVVATPWKWHIGHLLLYMKWLREDLREGLGKNFTEDFPEEELFNYGSEFDPEREYPALDELVEALRKVIGQIKSELVDYDSAEHLREHFERQEYEPEGPDEQPRERWMKSPLEALTHQVGHLSYHFGQMRLIAKAQNRWSWRPEEEREAAG